MEQLRHTVKRIDNLRLIVVDPISAYMGKTDSHRNAEVRAALTPAVEFAEEIGACLLCVTHLNKGGTGNALSRITGSIAFIAAARASFLVSRDNDDPDRRLMLPLKNNLAKDTHGFGYRIEEHNLSGIETSNVTWEKDSVDLTAEEVLSYAPYGIFLSNGPGDPAATGKYAVPVIKDLIKQSIPIFGICLGHQMLALA